MTFEVDTRAIEDAITDAADRLDLAPGRVRAVVRALVAAVANAHGRSTISGGPF